MVHPTPNGLVGHRHSALRQQILDVTQAEGEPEVEPCCLVNDLGRETIPGVADLVHPRWATRPPRTPQAQSAVTMPPGALSLDDASHDHRRWRRLQWLAPTAMEGGAATTCRRDRPDHPGLPLSTGDLEVEQDRAPHVLPHYPELAR